MHRLELSPNSRPRVAWRRLRERTYNLLTPRVKPWALRGAAEMGREGPLRWLRLLPPRPRPLDGIAPTRPWPEPNTETPPELRTVPGIARDPEAEERAFAEDPLHDFQQTHPEGVQFVLGHGWNFVVPNLPRLLRAYRHFRAARTSSQAVAVAGHASADAEQLTRKVRERAAEVGLSTVGFAPFDPKYSYAEHMERGWKHVIVCVLEQDWDATQTAPSGRAERAVFRAYGDLLPKVAALAEFLQGQGFAAEPHDFGGETAIIHYGVEAGLGQLGLNGQLLTPAAGSRCRLALVVTDAPLVSGSPVDYGVEKICDSCQLCVRRCPVGAIPLTRKQHRGVMKVKIKTDRCFPTVATMHGCAICMKVCPIQRYGLDAVKRHFVTTGEILGKGTDELEGYDWPVDGRHYGVDEKPRVDADFINPPGWTFDKNRTEPPGAGPRPRAR